MIAAGVLINASHNICFAHTEADIARVLGAYDHALAVLREALDRRDIDKQPRQPSDQADIFGPCDGVIFAS